MAVKGDVKPPCARDCLGRSETCHGTCEEYHKYCEKMAQIRLKRRLEGIRNAAKGVYGRKWR